MREQLVGTLESSFQAPLPYLRALIAADTEVRAVEYVIVPTSAAGAVAPPGDAQLAAYLTAHAERFSTPEYRDVTYAWIGPDDMTGQIRLAQQEIQQRYQRDQVKYDVAEKRDLEQIPFTSEAEPRAARSK